MFKKLIVFLAALSPGVVFAEAPRTFQELAYFLAGYLSQATAILVVLGIVIYFWGVIRHIIHTQQGKGGSDTVGYLLWGIVAIFVMVSIWGIIRILGNTLINHRGGGSPSPTLQAQIFNNSNFH